MIAGDTLNNISALLGEEIRKRRTALGMSQEELGYKSGISAAHLGQIERALKTPTITTAYNIASALGVSLSELFAFSSTDSLRSGESKTTYNKIDAYLSSMTESELKDVLKILKILKKSHK